MGLDTFVKIFLDRRYTAEMFERDLAEIYSDGYVSRHEENFLRLLTDPSSQVMIDKDVVATARSILDDRLFTAKAFEASGRKFNPVAQMAAAAKKDPSMDLYYQRSSGADDGYILSLQVYAANGSLQNLSFELPNRNGRYVDGTFTEDEDKVIAAAKAGMAYRSIISACENGKIGEEDFRRLIEAVDRIGVTPRSRIKDDPGPFFKLQGPKGRPEPNDLYETVIHDEMKRTGTRTIQTRGLKFTVPDGSEEWIREVRTQLEDELRYYPDYMLEHLKKGIGSITVFDPDRVYLAALEDGRIGMPPNIYLSWTRNYNSPDKPDIFISLKCPADVLLHELGHVLIHEVFPYSDEPSARISDDESLLRELTGREGEYAEDGMPTSYAGGGGFEELIPDSLLIFYREKVFHPFRAGTTDELKQEQPVLYLLFLQMDALMEKTAHGSYPWSYKAAFSASAMQRAQGYLATEGASWDDPINLDRFRNETLSVDFSDSSVR